MNVLIIINMCLSVTNPMRLNNCFEIHKIINNIVLETKKYDLVLSIIDEHEKTDNEFNYLPQHNLKSSSDPGKLLNYESQIKTPIHYLTKKTLSIIGSENNKRTLRNYNPSTITVVGFCASIDIVPSVLALIDIYPKVRVVEKCIGDITADRKQMAIEYLRFIGVPIL